MTECTVKKVGDLIQEKKHPEYGKALIVKVGDRRQTVCYQVLMYGDTSTSVCWLAKDYIECDCEIIVRAQSAFS